jgi:hypothetical protein
MTEHDEAAEEALVQAYLSQHGMVVPAEPGEQFVSTAEDRAGFETPNVRPVTTAPTPHPAAAPPTRPTPHRRHRGR